MKERPIIFSGDMVRANYAEAVREEREPLPLLAMGGV